MDSLLPMQQTQHKIGEQGATFINAFTTSPLCCPSRASLLTGLHAHNHLTINNSQSGGCYGDHWITNLQSSKTFPSVLKKNGYRTFYAGKYLNEYHGNSVPSEYDDFYGLQGNSRYYNFSLNINGEIKHFMEGEYLTDMLLDTSVSFIDKVEAPFMMFISPPAPHAPFTPSPEYSNVSISMVVPRTSNFNNGSDGKHWLVSMPPTKLSNSTETLIDQIFQNRLRTLLSVDKLVGSVVDKLQKRSLLDNTFIFYTSDNGYHLGQFGQPFDKRQPYECDIRVPLLVRGPGVAKKSLNEQNVALLDIASTIVELAGLEDFKSDGLSFAAALKQPTIKDVLKKVVTEEECMLEVMENKQRRVLLIEHWGEGNENTFNDECPWKAEDRLNQCDPTVACKCEDSWNNTYSCVRNIEPSTDYLYCRFNDHEGLVEAYNLLKDPDQLTNIGSTELPSIRVYYDFLLMKLTDCKGESCYST